MTDPSPERETMTCPDCRLPVATERKTRGAQVDKMTCGARFSRHYELECKRVAVNLLRAELADAQRLREADMRYAIDRNGALEIQARAYGAFDAAVCYQQFAEWFACGMRPAAIRGTDAKMIVMTMSNGLTRTEGDGATDPAMVRYAIIALLELERALREQERNE